MREESIFLWAFGHTWKEKNNEEHFSLACRRSSYNILPRKSIGALIGGRGARKWMKMLLAEILDLVFFSS